MANLSPAPLESAADQKQEAASPPPPEPYDSSNDPTDLELFRITVLGPARCGKTSMISAFVNNHSPHVYSPTLDPVLYHKTMCLPKMQTAGGGEESGLPILIEIEDTPGARDMVETKKLGGTDRYGHPRGVDWFLDPDGGAGGGRERDMAKELLNLCSGLDHPQKSYDYQPLAKTRMAFIVAYDATDDESYRGAVQVCDQLKEATSSQSLTPIIFFVAAKVDKVRREHELALHTRDEAKKYCNKKSVRFAEVSSLEFKQVRDLFREVLQEIRLRPQLWRKPQNEQTIGQSMMKLWNAGADFAQAMPGQPSGRTPPPPPQGGFDHRRKADGAEKKQDCTLQ
eukprot:TRINITY_DN34662_c0_g1_i1.p2 TRINITY_DN34662_c0_g1~~TRINITY_DN34662_c0_g1_i1.p2  ORF type:complete len:340 (-),score=104.45 TRINITY_DN34662_c0_g1_i1:42-1061(-)